MPSHIDLEAHAGDDAGASLVEYALLIALIALVVLAAVAFLGSSLDESLSKSTSEIFPAIRPIRPPWPSWPWLTS